MGEVALGPASAARSNQTERARVARRLTIYSGYLHGVTRELSTHSLARTTVRKCSLIPGGLNWLVVLGWLLSTATVRAASIDLTQTHFKLLSQDGSAVIGRATFEVVVQNGRRELVQGKYQFNNGEYDIDQDWLELRSRSTLPLLLRYRHAFFTRMVCQIGSVKQTSKVAQLLALLTPMVMPRPKALN